MAGSGLILIYGVGSALVACRRVAEGLRADGRKAQIRDAALLMEGTVERCDGVSLVLPAGIAREKKKEILGKIERCYPGQAVWIIDPDEGLRGGGSQDGAAGNGLGSAAGWGTGPEATDGMPGRRTRTGK